MADVDGYAPPRPIHRPLLIATGLGRVSEDWCRTMLLKTLTAEQQARLDEVLARPGRRGRQEKKRSHGDD